MPYNDLTNKHLNNLKTKIQERIPNNTGDAASSLEVSGNQLLGNDYIYYLVYGSKPWKDRSKWKALGYYMKLAGWDKRNPYAAAYKIAHEGSAIFRGERQGLPLDMLVDDMLNELYKELPNEAAAEALKWL